MENTSKFLKLLEKAVYDDIALIKVIEKIMNKINYFSSNSHKEIGWRFKKFTNLENHWNSKERWNL